MSQDLRRDRELNDTSGIHAWCGVHLRDGNNVFGMTVNQDWANRVVVAFKDAKYWREMSAGQTARNAELLEKLRDANAKVADANEALEQARRDAATADQDGKLAQIAEWLAKREATVATRASEAISPATGGFNDLGAIESRAAKLRKAQSDGKLLHELRQLLDGVEAPQPAVRYWLRDWGRGAYSVVRLDGKNAATWYIRRSTEWQLYPSDCIDDLLHGSGDIREITAAELPPGVTP
jgi:hypothetical protein